MACGKSNLAMASAPRNCGEGLAETKCGAAGPPRARESPCVSEDDDDNIWSRPLSSETSSRLRLLGLQAPSSDWAARMAPYASLRT
jgi:hypothetical protein